jgi:hypothetical protein
MEKKLEAFVEGQLCYVVLRSYKGEGEPVLILHEAASAFGGFTYGAGRTWVLQPNVDAFDDLEDRIVSDFIPSKPTEI